MTGHRVLSDMWGADNGVSDPGDGNNIIPEKDRMYVGLVTASSETRVLLDPLKAGKQITLGFKTDGGDCVVTASTAVNQTGNNTLTFADAGDEITLRSIEKGSDLVWRVGSNDGVGLSTV